MTHIQRKALHVSRRGFLGSAAGLTFALAFGPGGLSIVPTAQAKAAGRDPIPVTVYATPADPARVAALDAAGVTRCVFNLRAGDPDDVRWSLAKLGEMIRPYR